MAISTGKVVALIQAMGGADPAVIKAAVQDWLDAHPEATTTVQDGSITEQKLATSIAQKLGLISQLSDEIVQTKDALTNGNVPVNLSPEWINGYVNSSGVVKSSTASQTAIVHLLPGQTINVGTQNTNITIIGKTNSDTIAVGDTIEVIKRTSVTAQFESYSYTATEEMNAVVCVLKSNYTLEVLQPVPNPQLDYRCKNLEMYVPAVAGVDTPIPLTWGNGQIINGEDASGGSNRRTVGYIVNPQFVTLNITKATSQNLALYIVEYNANKEFIVSTPIYDLFGVYSPVSPDCKFVRLSTYSRTIPPAEQDQYISAYYSQANDPIQNIPNYFLADSYLSGKASRIKTLAESADDVFTFITDVHWERNAKHSPDLIRYLSSKCNVLRLFDGGDLADGLKYDAITAYRECFDWQIHRTVGNHDRFTPVNGKQLYYAFDSMNNDQHGNAFNHYYFLDNVQQKIRYIVLNSFYHTGSSNTSGWESYDADQVTWLQNTALNMPDTDWDAIVFTHFLRAVSAPTGNAGAIESTIDAFNADAANTGKILAVIQGHAHWDAIYHTAGGVPVITTTCDKWDLSNETSTIPAEGIAFRELGTKSEQAFDIMILNREEKTITAVRIGALAQNNIDKYRTDSGFTWIGTLEERVISYAE